MSPPEHATGRVYLVGAGPGDPGLITRRGLELLHSCDVVLYDRLVPEALVDEAPPHAERVFVGKRPGEVHSRQVVADALLIARAKEGRRVVRLKGGDPFVFGRGGEELEMLAAAGVPFEVVPGVTSAVAVPAYAGIPVTHRGLASSVAFVTAHEAADEPGGPSPTPEPVADADTLVLLMGVSALADVARRLIERGRPPTEPAALIEWGTTDRQRTVVGDLASIADLAREAGIRPPATAVIGEVVKLRDTLNWFENRPLFGLRVVVTRPRAQAGKLVSMLSGMGTETILLPTIAIADPDSWRELDWAVQKLAEGFYEWVIFPSANGVEKLWDRLTAAGRDARSFGGTKIAVVGTATAERLAGKGLRADLVPERFTAEDLAEALGHGAGHVLIPRAADAPQDVVRILEKHGWTPEEVVAYRTVTAAPEARRADAVRAGAFDVVIFSSASSAKGFVEMFGPPSELGLGPGEDASRLVACIGPVTADAARELGFRVDVVPAEHTSEGIVAALLQPLVTR
jgi:uroporphyrinogen III methyltransferase/synthase